MASTKIQNLPLKAPIGAMKIPTGGFGDYSITVSSIGDFIIDTFNLATKDYVDNLIVEKEDRISTTGGYLTPTSQNTSVPDTTNDVIDSVAQALLDRIEYVKDNFGIFPEHNQLTGRSTAGAHPSTSISHKSGTVYTYLQQNESDINTINNVSIPLINQSLLRKEDLIETNGVVNPTSTFSNVPSTNNSTINSSLQSLVNRDEFLNFQFKKGIRAAFDQNFANAINGYPIGSELVLSDGLTTVISVIPNNKNNPNTNLTGWKLKYLFTEVETQSDLTNIINPKSGQRVFVKSLQKTYIYDPNLLTPPNGVTVVDKWEMELQNFYYASWFAQVDTPSSDQSTSIQTGFDYSVSKSRPFIIDGKFYVEANQTSSGITNNAIVIRDNSILIFLPGGKLIQINQNKNQSNILLCSRISDFKIISPKITGDRLLNTFLPPTSDAQGFGYGITLYECSDGYIFEPQVSQCHGDNIYIGKPWGSNQELLPKNITIVRPVCDHARRNCISLTAWDNVKIIDPILSYAGDSDGITGAFPKSGIDVELESAEGFPVAQGYNGIITNPKFLNCDNGLFFYCSYDNRNFDMHIQGDSIINNVKTIGLGLFHGSNNCTGLVKIDNIKYLSSTFQEIALAWHKNSKLNVEIDNVYPLIGDSTFEIASILNGDFSTKELGNVLINNIHTVGFTPFTCDIGSDYKINGYQFYVSKNGKNGVIPYTNNPASQALLSGVNTFINSQDSYIHSQYSASSSKMPNEVWQDPSISPSDFITINSTGDYRILKIGLYYNSANIGNGCNINGLNLLIDGVAKTTAQTKTLGGWLKFQNTNGGRTKIIDSYGTWTFS